MESGRYTYALWARCVLEAMNVFTEISRHKAQACPAKGRQDLQSSGVTEVASR